MNNKMWYAGIGSRETPADALRDLETLCYELAQADFGLRSGGAAGADIACEAGHTLGLGAKQIFIPWNGFEPYPGVKGGPKRWHGEKGAILVQDPVIWGRAMAMAQILHPAWKKLKQGGQKLMTRNMFQVLGPELREEDKVKFILCWAPPLPGGGVDGGTGQAVRMAYHLKIPVLNLAESSVDEVRAHIRSLRQHTLDD